MKKDVVIAIAGAVVLGFVAFWTIQNKGPVLDTAETQVQAQAQGQQSPAQRTAAVQAKRAAVANNEIATNAGEAVSVEDRNNSVTNNLQSGSPLRYNN